VADIQKAGRPVFLDYTTHNCLTCDLNENRVFKAPGADTVMAAFERTKTAMLKARYAQDNSPPNVAIVRSLERFERKANFPVYVVYPADPSLRPFVLPVVIDQKTVIHALELASAKPGV
jgi:thiol:disulfide interchange protein DsbD